MRKIRVVPSKQASRIGSAVKWEADVESALKKSKEIGKPVFWYVPTLSGSFMDRKTEIDRYMMAGPFSWKPTVDFINICFIPVKATPSRKQMEKYGLRPYDFVEPGFVILKADGDLDQKVDRITTLQPEWFLRVLSRSLENVKLPPRNFAGYWKSFQEGKYEEIATSTLPKTAELQMFRAMSMFRLGQHDKAKQLWSDISKEYPEDPLGWKAAAEAEGIGPFVRGFEVHTAIKNDYANEKVYGTAASEGTFSEDELWNRGIKFLLGMQNSDGGFKDSDYDFGGTDSLPNVHVAVTALSGMSMLRALEQERIEKDLEPRVALAIQRAANYVSNDKNLNKVDRDEILWAYVYRLRFLIQVQRQLQLLNKYPPSILVPEALNADIERAVAALESVQSKRGSWYHEYSNPFVTATALAGLHEAKQAGFKIDDAKVSRGVEALQRDRMGNGAYPYNSSSQANAKPGNDRNIAASAGRMPLCEMGLWYFDQAKDDDLINAIARSISLQDNLNVALKYDDHTSHLAYGGFFFWYDMRARSEAISLVKNQEMKGKFQRAQKEIILSLPEIDGCFVDSHELGRVYGTAMALLSLSHCD